ncbi:hypothetical protein [Amorphus coralli]|uniref:hypothetical protein n=1 Tax=Amorphus coralli TaxID=340680 RepID=UPI00036A9D27|nr:hypothetical protein [Amorphus coralli]
MIDPFANCPSDEDTRSVGKERRTISGLDVLLESWVYDGIIGFSAILLEEQVSNLSDEEIVERLSAELQVDSNRTISRKGDGYVFVNYAFDVG